MFLRRKKPAAPVNQRPCAHIAACGPVCTCPPSETPLFDATVLATGVDPEKWSDVDHVGGLFWDLADLASPLTAEVSR